MHVSNFRPVKRVRDVVAIFARVRERFPSVLVMVGDGPDRVAAELEAHTLGVEKDVFFLGKIDVVAPLLAEADLFLLPTQSESFGLSALEALASGVPVIGTRAGGMVEVVRDGETGILCPVGDVEGMSDAAISILGDRARWQEMSERGAADARVTVDQHRQAVGAAAVDEGDRLAQLRDRRRVKVLDRQAQPPIRRRAVELIFALGLEA
jgi:N-acetyl-alpha-D-glucosaminyl L-malate synthase BshA